MRQQSEAAPRHGPQEDAILAIGKLVLAITEKREVIVDHPVEQLLAFVPQLLVNAARSEVDQPARLAHFFTHLRPVAHGDPNVAQDFLDLLFEEPDLLRVRLLVDSEPDERFGLALRIVRFQHRFDLAATVAYDPDNRMDGDVDSQTLTIDCREYRVHEETACRR